MSKYFPDLQDGKHIASVKPIISAFEGVETDVGANTTRIDDLTAQNEALSDEVATKVSDSDYVHTDNNFSDSYKALVDGAAQQADVESMRGELNNKPGTKRGSNVDVSGNNPDMSEATESFVSGKDNSVKAYLGFVHGNKNQSEGSTNTAIGYGNRVTGEGAAALGVNNVATGTSAVTIGRRCVASGAEAVAMGLEAVASGDCQTVVGQYNKEDASGNNVFIVGNGTGKSNKSNAFVVRKNGVVDVYGNMILWNGCVGVSIDTFKYARLLSGDEMSADYGIAEFPKVISGIPHGGTLRTVCASEDEIKNFENVYKPIVPGNFLSAFAAAKDKNNIGISFTKIPASEKIPIERGCLYYMWTNSKITLYEQDGTQAVDSNGETIPARKFIAILAVDNVFSKNGWGGYYDLILHPTALGASVESCVHRTTEEAPNIYAQNTQDEIMLWRIRT